MLRRLALLSIFDRNELSISAWLSCLTAAFVGLWTFAAAASCDVSSQARLDPQGQRTFVLLKSAPPAHTLRDEAQSFAQDGVSAREAVRAALSMASDEQKSAIGQGFARAVRACRGRDQNIARQIDAFIRSVGDRALTQAYVSEIGDEPSKSAASSSSETKAGKLRAGHRLGADDDPTSHILSDPWRPLSLPGDYKARGK